MLRLPVPCLIAIVLLSIAWLVPASAQTGKPRYSITVTRGGKPLGTITIETFPDIAPKAAANFDSLVAISFYDSTAFHRVIPGFMIQGGDPNSKNKPRSTWGYGDPSQQTVPAEFTRLSHTRGMMSAARANDPNSATSQFFLCVGNPTYLDGKYSIHGRVLAGMDVVDTIVSSPRDANDNPIEKVEMKITRVGIDTSRPGATTLSSPADGATHIGSASTLQWSKADSALLYELQIAATPDFATLVIDTLAPNQPFTLTTIERGFKTFYWRARATNGGRRGDFSSVWSFTTGIAIPTLVSPDSGATSVKLPPLLTWRRVEGATKYHVQVATSPLFGTIVADRLVIADTTLSLDSLNLNQRYYWRVSAFDDIGETPPSPTHNFRTSATSAVDIATDEAPSLSVTTPTHDPRIDIDLTLPRGCNVTFTLSDATGSAVYNGSSEWMESGNHHATIDARTMSSGVYFLCVRAGNGLRTAMCAIIR